MTSESIKNPTADKSENFDNLNPAEKKIRLAMETKIRNGLKAYHKVGEALTVISQGRLYRSTHSTMAKYSRDVWDMTTARVSQYQHAYRVHQLLSLNGFAVMPKTESQCRPLARFELDANQDAKIVKAWRLAVDAGGRNITAKIVNDAVDSVLGIEPKSASTDDTAGDTAGDNGGGRTSDGASASAEARAEVRELKRKIAYLESCLTAEKEAHKRTMANGSAPKSAMAKKLYKAGFRAMAKQYHPDHGGNAADMTELNELKSTLGI